MSFIDQLRDARVYDLGQPYFVGMPHFPTHPPYLFSLTKGHGDLVLKNGASSSAESIALGGHVGTHIDALCHFSCGGRFFGGVEAESIQSVDKGFSALGSPPCRQSCGAACCSMSQGTWASMCCPRISW